MLATSPKLSLVSVEPPSRNTLVRAVQPSNTLLPMLATLFEMVMPVKLMQSENAEFPMLVTLSGIVMLVKPVQTENASFPMLVMPSSITTFIMLLLSYAGLLSALL